MDASDVQLHLVVHADKGVAVAAGEGLMLRPLRLTVWQCWADDCPQWYPQVAGCMLLIEYLHHDQHLSLCVAEHLAVWHEKRKIGSWQEGPHQLPSWSLRLRS